MRTHLLFVLLASISATALAADQCTFIRPPGLSAEQVDRTVLTTYAQALSLDPAKIDKTKTVTALDGTENAIMNYAFATLAVGEVLGFDAIRAFFEAATAKGGTQPFGTLSVTELQATRMRSSNLGWWTGRPRRQAVDPQKFRFA